MQKEKEKKPCKMIFIVPISDILSFAVCSTFQGIKSAHMSFFFSSDFKYFLKRKCCTILSRPIFLAGEQLTGLVLIYKALQGLDHILPLETVYLGEDAKGSTLRKQRGAKTQRCFFPRNNAASLE